MPPLNEATAIRMGGFTVVKAVYLGDTKVWPPAAPPPTGPAVYLWAGTSGSVIVTAHQVQRYGTGGAAVFHQDGPLSGPALDFAAAVGKTLTLTGRTSGYVHSSAVTGNAPAAGKPRLALTAGIPTGTTFTVGEEVEATLQ